MTLSIVIGSVPEFRHLALRAVHAPSIFFSIEYATKWRMKKPPKTARSFPIIESISIRVQDEDPKSGLLLAF